MIYAKNQNWRTSQKPFSLSLANTVNTGVSFDTSSGTIANQKFFAGEHQQFNKEAADLLLEIGIIKQIPDLKSLADTSFIK